MILHTDYEKCQLYRKILLDKRNLKLAKYIEYIYIYYLMSILHFFVL